MAYKHILDTHALIWYIEGNPKLSGRAKGILDDRGNEFVLPLIALAEATFIIERGRTSIPSISILMMRVQTDPRIEVYPLTWEVFQQSLVATTIPEIHDRLIVATALHLQSLGHTVSLVTRDGVITQSGIVPVIW